MQNVKGFLKPRSAACCFSYSSPGHWVDQCSANQSTWIFTESTESTLKFGQVPLQTIPQAFVFCKDFAKITAIVPETHTEFAGFERCRLRSSCLRLLVASAAALFKCKNWKDRGHGFLMNLDLDWDDSIFYNSLQLADQIEFYAVSQPRLFCSPTSILGIFYFI